MSSSSSAPIRALRSDARASRTSATRIGRRFRLRNSSRGRQNEESSRLNDRSRIGNMKWRLGPFFNADASVCPSFRHAAQLHPYHDKAIEERESSEIRVLRYPWSMIRETPQSRTFAAVMRWRTATDRLKNSGPLSFPFPPYGATNFGRIIAENEETAIGPSFFIGARLGKRKYRITGRETGP